LNINERLLHHVVTHQVYPTGGGYNSISSMKLFFIMNIVEGRDYNLPLLILIHMIKTTKRMKGILPCGIVLTLIFKHFGVPLDNEMGTEMDTYDTYNADSINQMG
ncbi:hypothetical protein CFOL_v3_17697, partial [Cephalotus follicularis]